MSDQWRHLIDAHKRKTVAHILAVLAANASAFGAVATNLVDEVPNYFLDAAKTTLWLFFFGLLSALCALVIDWLADWYWGKVIFARDLVFLSPPTAAETEQDTSHDDVAVEIADPPTFGDMQNWGKRSIALQGFSVALGGLSALGFLAGAAIIFCKLTS